MTELLPPIYEKHRIEPPEKRSYERPVAWLLGRQLINSLKGTLLYMALGNKLDARDWMTAEVCRYEDKRAKKNEQTKEDEFWFDFIADTGDGMCATYSVAYLTMSRLWVKKLWPDKPPEEKDNENGGDKVKLEKVDGFDVELPRGEFLFVGGDTAYHLSDYLTLAGRFQLPFRWAFADLVAQGRIGEDYCRRIFGIPANHDYYDQLDGFRRQFLTPVRDEPCGKLSTGVEDPQLMIPGHRRSQRSSYLALRLPFEWWLWGLDTEVGEVDERQRKFFRAVKFQKKGPGGKGAAEVETSLEEGGQPEKLIVVTSVPTTIFGKYADPVKDTKAAKAFLQLGLPVPFLRGRKPQEGEPPLSEEQLSLPDGHVRLDVAGDVHLYGRYWGPESGENPRAGARAKQPHADNYASVVSGIGGAFHHPSTTYVDEVREQTLYPSAADSRAEVAREIFKPWKLMNGGGVWLAGLIGALVIYFAATVAPSSRDAVNNFYLDFTVPVLGWRVTGNAWDKLGLASKTKVCPTVPASGAPEKITPFPLWSALGIAPKERDPLKEFRRDPECTELPNCPQEPQPAYFWGPCAVKIAEGGGSQAAAGSAATAPDSSADDTPDDYGLGVALYALTFLPIVLVLVFHKWFFKDPDLEMEGANWRPSAKAKKRPWYAEHPFLKNLFLAVLPMFLLTVLGVFSVRPYRANITPFGNSLLVLLSLVWAAAAVALLVFYTEWLFHKAMVRRVTRGDWALTWVMVGYAVLAVVLGIWFFGQNNLTAYTVIDIYFVLSVLVCVVGLTLLGYFKAGEMERGLWRKLPFGVLGLVHGLVQLAAAFVLVRKGSWGTLLAAVALALLMIPVGSRLMKSNRRGWLVAVGLAYAAVMLLLPYLTFTYVWPSLPVEPFGKPISYYDSGGLFSRESLWFLPDSWAGINFHSGWWGLVPSIAAGIVGAGMSCVWLGWYLAVALAFHGHNNEAGGAARIERFKQFIRFRITPDDITGYVIAVDDPQREGKNLKPKLIDVFRLPAK